PVTPPSPLPPPAALPICECWRATAFSHPPARAAPAATPAATPPATTPRFNHFVAVADMRCPSVCPVLLPTRGTSLPICLYSDPANPLVLGTTDKYAAPTSIAMCPPHPPRPGH